MYLLHTLVIPGLHGILAKFDTNLIVWPHCHLIVSPLERESLNLLFSLHFSVTFPTVFHFIKNIPVYLYNQSKFYEFKTVVLIPPIIDSITSALVRVLASKVQALKVTTYNSISRLKISFK